jgi:hypothetical protein
MPRTWAFALFCSTIALVGIWIAAPIAIMAHITQQKNFALYLTVPILFLTAQFVRTVLRQIMIAKLLPGDAKKLRIAAAADIGGNLIWTWLMFACIAASAIGRTITWRGIKYKLVSATKTIKL